MTTTSPEQLPSEECASPGPQIALKTLSCIEHVLRLYWSPDEFEADPRALEWLLDNGLIGMREDKWWFVTPKGAVYVEAIRDLPLPIQVTEWRVP